MNTVKAFVLYSCVSLAVLLVLACGGNAEALDPENGTVTPSGSGNTTRPIPTSTPWPQFGPPPVTAASITATVQSAPGEPSEEPDRESNASPEESAGNGNTEINPEARTTVGTRTVPARTPSPLDTSGTFSPQLGYEYIVPDDWVEVIGDDEIVLEHVSGKARITLTEKPVNRATAGAITHLVVLQEPDEFVDWSERALSDQEITGVHQSQFEYSGTRLGVPYLAFVEWYLWGDLLIQVSIEAEANAWVSDSKLRNNALFAASSFMPDSESSFATQNLIEGQLRVRFNQRRSGILSGSPGDSLRSDLSCREVFHNLLSDPFYSGAGVWQAFAVSDQGVQVWHIYEPSFSIVPADHNTSTC